MTDLARWNVHGPVRTLEREIANWDRAHETWQTARKFSSATFRSDGKISEFTCHNPDGSNARRAFVYDNHGRVIESQFWMDGRPFDSAQGRLPTRVINSYDAHGRLTAASEIGPDGIHRQTETTEYDSSGRRTTVRVLPAAPAEMPVTYGVEGTELSYGAPGAVTLTTVYDERECPAEATFRGVDQRRSSSVRTSTAGKSRTTTGHDHGGIRTSWLNEKLLWLGPDRVRPNCIRCSLTNSECPRCSPGRRQRE